MRRSRAEWWTLGAVLALALALRWIWPLADPPARLSWSTGIYTDPASKTLPAVYAARFGDWNLAEGQYLHAFPLANGLAWSAYQILGVSRTTQQLLTGLLSTAGLLALALALGRGPGGRTALLGSALGAVSWWLIMFGRVPVVENLVALLLAFACVAALSPSTRGLFLAGGLAAVATFFGKYHAVAFFPALLLFAVARTGSARAALWVLAGAAPVGLVWAVAVFLPNRDELLTYVQRVSTGVHGALPVTSSPANAFLDLFRSVQSAWVFHHAPVLATLGLVFALRTVTDRRLWKQRVANGSALFALWFLIVWVYYALLSYNAPRYYVVVALPLTACAACQLGTWFAAASLSIRRPSLRAALGNVVTVFAVTVVLGELVRQYTSILRLSERTRRPDDPTWLSDLFAPLGDALASSTGHLAWAAAGAGVILAGWWLLSSWRGLPSVPGRRLAITVLAVALLIDLAHLGHWATHRKYVLEEIKTALPSLVGADAVLLGPFAAVLTQDSPFLAISWLDPIGAEAERSVQRVTHRISDERSEESGIQTRLPERVTQAQPVQGWMFRTRYVRRIELSRLPDAANHATPFELAAQSINRGEWSQALALLQQQRDAGGPLPEILFKEATCQLRQGNAGAAAGLLEAAVQARPEDPLYLQNLGALRAQAGDTPGARDLWRRGLRADPHNPDLLQFLRATSEGEPAVPR